MLKPRGMNNGLFAFMIIFTLIVNGFIAAGLISVYELSFIGYAAIIVSPSCMFFMYMKFYNMHWLKSLVARIIIETFLIAVYGVALTIGLIFVAACSEGDTSIGAKITMFIFLLCEVMFTIAVIKSVLALNRYRKLIDSITAELPRIDKALQANYPDCEFLSDENINDRALTYGFAVKVKNKYGKDYRDCDALSRAVRDERNYPEFTGFFTYVKLNENALSDYRVIMEYEGNEFTEDFKYETLSFAPIIKFNVYVENGEISDDLSAWLTHREAVAKDRVISSYLEAKYPHREFFTLGIMNYSSTKKPMNKENLAELLDISGDIVSTAVIIEYAKSNPDDERYNPDNPPIYPIPVEITIFRVNGEFSDNYDEEFFEDGRIF